MSDELKDLPPEMKEAVLHSADTMSDAQSVEQVKALLAVSEKGQVLNTPGNYKTVFLSDPLLKGAFCYNLLTNRIDIVKPLGWKRDSEQLTDVDTQYLMLYIKSFLSRQKDTYKVPYAIHPKDYKRQCVFAGTSNTLDFLPLDRTGNRRFLPIMVQTEQAEVHILENEAASRAYIDQMWAEIMVIYRQGNFKLKLSRETERYLQDHQKEFMPEDTQAMQILNYLDNFKGKIVCSLQLYYEALGHPTYDEPKQCEIRDINSIMNNYAVGWKAFDNPRHFPAPYNRQKGWERIQSADNGDAQNDGFRKVTDEEARQMGMPDEWLKPKNE